MSKQNVIDNERKRGDYTMFIDKLVWVGVLCLLQAAFLVYAYLQLREHYFSVQFVMTAISIIVVLYIINRPINPAYKLAWGITILIIPVFGGFFYLLLSVNSTRRAFRKSIRDAVAESKTHLSQDMSILDQIEEHSKHAVPQARYIYNLAKYPVYQNTNVQYFASGEEMFITLLDELEKAKHFIFM